MNNNTFDVIIIGSGLGGLSAGALLAQKNKKCLVIEKHDKVGGFATCFKRGVYTFESALHNMGPLYDNEYLVKILKELKVLDKIEYRKFDEFQRIIFPEHDFVIKNGTTGFIHYLVNNFKEEEKGIKTVFKTIKSPSQQAATKQ